MDADAIRTEKLKVLSALRRIGAGDAAAKTVRGQYRAGLVNGAKAPGYAEEVGKRDAHRDVRRDQGRGRQLALGRRAVLSAHRQAHGRAPLRNRGAVQGHAGADLRRGAGAPNRLVLRLQPDEGVRLWLNMKEPGPGGLRVKTAPLDLSFAEEFAACAIRTPTSAC